MKIKNFTLYSLLIFIIIGLNSCSSDSDSSDDQEIVISVETTNFTTTINENPSIGDVIGIVEGTTNQGSITFSITEQTPAGAFAIDAQTGELTVSDNSLFDFEINTSVTGIVKVANDAVFENAAITISINDIDEVNICEGNVYLLTQEDVNAFGANNCTEITGDLVIGSSDVYVNIVDLTPLLSLQSVKNLAIINAEELTSLHGLNNLSSSIDLITLYHNTSLTSMEALSGVTSIFGLYFYENHSLQSLNGLHNISGTVAAIDIRDNDALLNVDALSNITLLTSSFLLGYNSSLINIDGLSNITSIGSQFALDNNSSLQNIDGLSSLTDVGINGNSYGLSIIGNDLIQNLDGLSNLNPVFSSISIDQNTSLTNIEGLSHITTITNSISIKFNSSLTNLNGLQNLTSIGDIFELRFNDTLNDLSALNNINDVSDFRISHNNLLTNLDGLENLSSINHFLVFSNPVLTNYCSLEYLFINGNPPNSFEVYDNAYNPTDVDMINGNCSL